MKSTRQILASYMKEGSKLEISITVPEDYPISYVFSFNSKLTILDKYKLNVRKVLKFQETSLINTY